MLPRPAPPPPGPPHAFRTATPRLRRPQHPQFHQPPHPRSLIAGTWGDGPGIAYRGAYADYATTILDAPTVSGPNHTSIYTGVTAVDHGVTGNNDAQMAAVTFPDYLKLLKNANPAL